jgi:hypothetical protein
MLNSLKCWFQQLHNKCELFPQHTKCQLRSIILNITSKFVNSKFGFHQLPFLEPHSQNYPWFHNYKNAISHTELSVLAALQGPTTLYGRWCQSAHTIIGQTDPDHHIQTKYHIIWNRHVHECSNIWKSSGNFTLIHCIKKCRDCLGRDILRTTFFFRAESSFIQSSCRSFIRVIVSYEISKVKFLSVCQKRFNKLKNINKSKTS